MNQISTENTTKIKIKNIELNYLKVGNGPQTLLMLPGVLGTIDNFKLLIPMLDKKRYTIIVLEPPGYGCSRPPDRDFPPGYLHRDADYTISFMEALNKDRYSVLGWCDGGTVALIVASKAVDRVEKLVVWSCKAYVTAEDLGRYERTRRIENRRRLPGLDGYSEWYLSVTWNACIDAHHAMVRDDGGDICRAALPGIGAPTLILHGALDDLVPQEHAFYLHEHIKRSSLEMFPEGGHFFHFKFPEQFYSRVEEFLSSTKQRQLPLFK